VGVLRGKARMDSVAEVGGRSTGAGIGSMGYGPFCLHGFEVVGMTTVEVERTLSCLYSESFPNHLLYLYPLPLVLTSPPGLVL
jgi:hypothetical protein